MVLSFFFLFFDRAAPAGASVYFFKIERTRSHDVFDRYFAVLRFDDLYVRMNRIDDGADFFQFGFVDQIDFIN